MGPDGTLDILVCDDDPDLRSALCESFEREGHRTVAVPDGESALGLVERRRFDVLLLDVALGPGSPDGYAVCRRLRASGNLMAVIMLTAKDTEADAVMGLEAGADDYVVKPFRPTELRSRVRAVLRRARPAAPDADVLVAGPLVLDVGRRQLHRDGEPVELTFSEFEVLRALMSEPKRLLSRQELLRAIWGDSAYRDPRAIDVHIRHLRAKLERDPENPELIFTVRGVGYGIQGS